MNDKEYDAFMKTAKRIKDASRGKITMQEAQNELAKQLRRADREKKNRQK
jgi:hypothetical protein